MAEVRPIITWIHAHDIGHVWANLVLHGDGGRGFPLGEVVRLVTEATGHSLDCGCQPSTPDGGDGP